MIKDQFQYSDRFDNQCLSCGHYGHDIQDCSQIHYNVNKQIFLQRIARSPFQPRGKIKSVLIKQIQRNKVKCLKSLKNIKTDLKLLRWKYAKNTYDNYSDLNVHELTQINENDRDFFLRCPKIKISVQKKEQNFKDVCEIKIFDEFEREQNYSTSSESDSMQDSDYQSIDQQQNFQVSNSQKLISLIKTEIINLQTITDKEQNQDAVQLYKKRQSNTEKEMTKATSRQSFSKNPEEIQQQMNSISSFRDKRINQNSAKSLDNEESEKNYNYQNHSDVKGTLQKKKQQATLNLLEEKQEGDALQTFKKQLDDVLVKLDTIQKREDENIMASLQKSLKGSQKQIIIESSSMFNDPKDVNHQHIQSNQEHVKNFKLKFSRREGMRKTQIKNPFQSRNEERQLSIATTTKQSQQKEGYYENTEVEQSHIFGVLKFNFDKMKEFSLYYPKNNYSNIIKSYKKIQGKPNDKSKPRKTMFFQNAVNTSDVFSQRHSNTPKYQSKMKY